MTPPGSAAPLHLATAALTSWCEVDLATFGRNVAALGRAMSSAPPSGPAPALGIVVKSDAYGHGLLACAVAARRAGARWLIVNSVAEAQRLRSGGLDDVEILVCGPVLAAQAEAVVAAGADLVLYDPEVARALSAAADPARGVGVHLKVETGTHRQGVPVDAVVDLARAVDALPGLRLRGVCTHFADVEDGQDHRFARQQLACLQRALRQLTQAGFRVLCHAGSSAAALLLPASRGDLVRVGIAAYGLWPSPDTEALARAGGVDLELSPVLTWRARVAQVKDLAAGASVGYGRTWISGAAAPARRLAVLPVGYYEGLPRSRSNLGHVLVRGIPAPVRGRICMNMCMVEVTEVEARTGSRVQAGEVATLIGRDGGAEIPAALLAEWTATLHYEVLARIHPSIPRLDTRTGATT